MVLRVPTVVQPVINGDESIYAIVASQMRQGFWPYTTAFDHKPIGIYYHFALAQMIGGDTPAASRWVGIVVVAVGTAVLFWLLRRGFGLGPVFAFVLSVGFVLASSGLGGNAANSEIIVNAYTLAWLILLVTARAPALPRMLAAGALMGVSFQVNYLTGFILVGLAVGVLCAAAWTERGRLVPTLRRTAGSGALMLAGFAVANVVFLLPLALRGDLFAYFAEQAAFLTGYHPGAQGMPAVQNVAITLRDLAPILFVGGFLGVLGTWRAIRSHRDMPDAHRLVPAIFIASGVLAGSLVAAVASGHFFDHYFLLLLPGAFVLIGAGLAAAGSDRRFRALVLVVTLGCSVGLGLSGFLETARGGLELARRAMGEPSRPDRLIQVATAAQHHLPPGGMIYVTCAQPVLYQMLGSDLPTRYFYYLHHMNRSYTRAVGITPEAEVAAVMDKRPDLVVVGGNGTCAGVTEADAAMMRDALRTTGYRKVDTVAGHEIFLIAARG